MTRAVAVLLGIVVTTWAPVVRAQTPPMVIEVEGRAIRTIGGEQPNVFTASRPLTVGTTMTAFVMQLPGLCGLAVSQTASAFPNATAWWTVDATATEIDGGAVKVRVRWIRDGRSPSRILKTTGGREATLRPGESITLDVIPAAGDDACDMEGAVLRLNVRHWPYQQFERRLLATDLWLVERMPDGSERSRGPLTVRGLVNESVPFYFDTLVDSGVSLDIFGQLVSTPNDDRLSTTLEVRSRIVHNGQSSLDLPDGGNRFRARFVKAALTLSADDVAGVELPRLAEHESGAFANRQFSIRLKVRRLR